MKQLGQNDFHRARVHSSMQEETTLLALAYLLFFSGCKTVLVDVRLESSHPAERAFGDKSDKPLVLAGPQGWRMTIFRSGCARHTVGKSLDPAPVIFRSVSFWHRLPVRGGMTNGTSEGRPPYSLESPTWQHCAEVAKQWACCSLHIISIGSAMQYAKRTNGCSVSIGTESQHPS